MAAIHRDLIILAEQKIGSDSSNQGPVTSLKKKGGASSAIKSFKIDIGTVDPSI